MGHIRLGRLPRTRSFQKVVSLLGGAAPEAPLVADATLKAAVRLRPILEKDPGLIQSFHFLAQVCYSARTDGFFDRCEELGIDLSKNTNREIPLAFLASASSALESRVRSLKGRTFFSDIALQSFREALTKAVNLRPIGLFGTSEQQLKDTFRALSKTSEFNAVARDFFSSFLRRTLRYFISKELHNHIGASQPFHTLESTGEFEQGLKRYADERARIVERFAGEYTSKQNWHGELNEETARRFIYVAVKKLTEELRVAEEFTAERQPEATP